MEQRKKKRYRVFFRAYFPEFNEWGYAVNVSADGCYIHACMPASTGFVTDFLLELPVIGVIPLKGYVQHKESDDRDMGLELVKVKFDVEQSDIHNIYQQFIEILDKFENIRDQYMSLVEDGVLQSIEFPVKYPMDNVCLRQDTHG